MEILTWTWSGDLEYETLRNALEDAVPVKVLAGANLTLRAETADGGSDQMQEGGVGEFARNSGWHACRRARRVEVSRKWHSN